MKKIIFISAISILILIGIYNVFFSHTKINVNDVNSISINNKIYKADSDIGMITNIVSMYNEATIFRKNVGTTPSHIITIQLNNGRQIEIHGTTQGFHYVTEGSKSYRISSPKLSKYLRNLINSSEDSLSSSKVWD